ncbi:uncharacterized protein LOC8259782 isoform X1 [Ricinus communis]|uniref:uncharacterized protein LOC8259782 isoform X1 n=1 Tax=Ricinus communis TaxID=3988 RepID=UPI000772811A|nr:uncharacterized protein LOC8259782 isoform X1 [Ricinus communis]XP_048236144.1 uncharacterized protein LOC8259782 isoform X1 [Ricinus communis]|eukprot:XP_015577814.1 uncharacterized protein LOC8259782 isoform X1 [Ricinus communis]
MGKNGKISEYRERLDKTLASPELTNDDALKILIKNQLLRSSLNEDEGCSENVIDRKTREVSYFLDMLRSASVSEHETSKTGQTSHSEWKLKDDNEEYRVMYRPGPHGTPLHTLLVEGYVDGPLDICLCISWELTLYRKWWPQISFPPFKITSCKCLQKVQVGEHVSFLRVKVTWPLSAREAIVHYFLFEYLKDGLVVVLVNSISDSESIDKSTHGFTRDGIPEAKDVVRIDLVGGFAIQKVTPERSYFRTIATVDLKLDFVPPTLLNFISRQLIGSGFRLYQKAVASVSNYDEDYSKILEDPMYARIHEALVSVVEPNETMERQELQSDSCLQEDSTRDMQNSLADMEQNISRIEDASESVVRNEEVTDKKTFAEIEEGETHESEGSIPLKDEIRCTKPEVHSDNHVAEILQNTRKEISEIEEEESGFSIDLEDDDRSIDEPITDKVANRSPVNWRTNIMLSPEVERALDTLETAISLVRERGSNSLARFSPVMGSEGFPNLQKSAERNSTFVEEDVVSSDTEVSVEAPKKGRTVERTSHDSKNSSGNHDVSWRTGSNSFTREMNHNKIAPAASPEQFLSPASESNQVLGSSRVGITDRSIKDPTLGDDKQMRGGVNGFHENGMHEENKLSRQKNHRFCCFGPSRQ